MAELLTIAGLAAGIALVWAVLKHRIRRNAARARERVKDGGHVTPDELRDILGREWAPLQRSMLTTYIETIDEQRRTGIAVFNQLAGTARKVTEMHRDRGGRKIILTLDNGWQISIQNETAGVYNMIRALERGPLRLEKAEEEDRDVVLRFQSVPEGTSVTVRARLAAVTQT